MKRQTNRNQSCEVHYYQSYEVHYLNRFTKLWRNTEWGEFTNLRKIDEHMEKHRKERQRYRLVMVNRKVVKEL